MRTGVSIHKASIYSIIINAIQISAIIAMVVLMLLTDMGKYSMLFVNSIVIITAGLVIWGAVVDIQQALTARKVSEQADMLEEAYGQLLSLNVTLRAQRHDFMNHLQVVDGLIDMEEYEEAAHYIERVYGDILSVSSALQTANAAVNALLKVKLGESQKRGVFMDLHIQTAWADLSIPGWEMCRVLGNLIDNGLDALEGVKEPRLTVTLSEDTLNCCFSVENNGPQVPEAIQNVLFQSGFTTKGSGRGMGLAIVKQIVIDNGGGIEMESTAERTQFRGWLPRNSMPAKEENTASIADS